MLIPHLHFGGNCAEAIILYEKVFRTKTDTIIYNRDYASDSEECENKIAHAVMNIHGQKVFQNDRFGKTDRSTNVALHLIVEFNSVMALLDCTMY